MIIEYKDHRYKDKGGDDSWLECHGESMYIRINADDLTDDPLQYCPHCGQKLEQAA